ncbi:glycosyltransferase [Clostridium lacusfryxellense]|uniref:glycosyltransferase n=1 Tax=Clostridium lacusfryxellense TaxID=205328 RepID=UPI001C0B89A0|nr:glycosyltransferase [Clostridium lacusfryxellense]
MKELIRLADENANIIFKGNVGGKFLTELYCKCSFYVLPSDIEGIPLTLLEALSYGKKVLVIDIKKN